MNLSNLKIRTQILIVLVIPIIGMVFFFSGHVIDKYNFIQKRQYLSKIVKITPVISSVIHDLQKERAYSVFYKIYGENIKYKNILLEQRLKTDGSQKKLKLALDTIENEKYGIELNKNIIKSKGILKKTKDIRKKISSSSIDRQHIMSGYTGIIKKLISIMTLTSSISEIPDINIDLSSYGLLESIKEYSGQESILGVMVIDLGVVNHDFLHKLDGLKSKETSLLTVFNNLLIDEEILKYISKKYGEAINGKGEVDKVRSIILASGGSVDIDLNYSSNQWFDIVTKRMNKIKAAQAYLINDVFKDIEEHNTKARKSFVFNIFNIFVILFITFFLWLFIQRSITKPIEETTDNLKKLAEDDLSFEIEETDRKDEIGDIIRTMAIFKLNVLERKKYYEQQRVFISMVSHEFRTPLTIIDGNAQIIQRRGASLEKEILEKRAAVIRTAVDRLVGLIETILSDSVLSGGELEIKTEMYSLASIVKEACMEKLGVSPNAQIKLDLDKSIPDMMLDPKVMHHVVMNLISNAFKYSPDNPMIKVKLYKHEEKEKALLEVSDNGLGIPEDELPKIFTRYFRASTSGGISGTGLGLNLVKQMVELHGGQAYIESEVDVGTTVTIEIPIIIKSEEEDI